MDIPIYNLVRNRLPFLEDTEDNQNLVNDFFQEVAWELEPCFRVSYLEDGTVDEDQIGVEANYNMAQRSVIADLVSVYILLLYAVANTQGTSTVTPATTFLKRAKAGSAEVEWGQFSIKDGLSLTMGADALINRYRDSAMRKARNFGCIIDICGDCVGVLQSPLPFITVTGCGCGC